MNDRRPMIIIVLVAVILALLTGGLVYGIQQGRIASCRESLTEARRDLQQASERVRELEAEVSLLRQHPSGGSIPPDFLAVYGATDESPGRPVVEYYVAARGDLPVLQKLRTLASTLSRQKFAGLPIDVVGVGVLDGRRVAMIDLRELHDGLAHPTWRAGYFQGSTGGAVTQTTLVTTFLQRDHRGEWVDGVRFLYQGEPMREGEWDHIDLAGVHLR